jgi:SNF2 family DNA or RNA helicase
MARPMLLCRPILTLPPAKIEVKYCELSETEKDFYEALFRRSKVMYFFTERKMHAHSDQRKNDIIVLFIGKI